jgi:hypothetical protein
MKLYSIENEVKLTAGDFRHSISMLVANRKTCSSSLAMVTYCLGKLYPASAAFREPLITNYVPVQGGYAANISTGRGVPSNVEL